MRPFIAKLAAVVGLALGGSASAHAAWGLNMPQGVTPLSRETYDLHMLIFWICTIIGVVVFGAILISLIRFRKSKGAVAAQWHESMAAEVSWTVVPFLILVGMAIPAAQTLIDMEDNSGSELTVTITGYQWNWHYEYVGEDVDFYSFLSTSRQAILDEAPKGEDYLLEVDNRLVLPVGAKVRLHHTSGDVIHSWWVPDLSVKKDAIPGYVNTNWVQIEEPGVYTGQCAELCGRGHGFMPIVVEALPQDEFDAWLEEQKQQAQASVEDGGALLAATRQ